MAQVVLDEYVRIGYLLTRWEYKGRWQWEYAPSELIPDRIVTLTHCITKFAPGMWAWYGNEHIKGKVEEAAGFGVMAEQLDEVKAWVDQRCRTGEIDFWELWQSLPAAREFARRFLRCEDLILIGAGLHRSLVQSALEHRCTVTLEYEAIIRESLGRDRRIEGSPEVLGFDLLAYDTGVDCSWICISAMEKLWRELGVRPNAYGLVEEFEDAKRCCDLINSWDPPPEPGLWIPVLVVRYPLAVE